MKKRAFASTLAAAFAISAMALAASAQGFEASVSGALYGAALSPQTLVTTAGTVECRSWEPTSGSVAAGRFITMTATVEYSKCVELGFVGTSFEVQWEFNQNGEVAITEEVMISPLEGCWVYIPPQVLKLVSYTQTGLGTLEVEFGLTSLTSYGVGALCAYAEESSGTWEGIDELGVSGGTLK